MARNRTTLPGDLLVPGHLTVGSMDLPEEAVGDINWDPADPLSADNQQHQHSIPYSQDHGVDVVAHRKVIHMGYGSSGVFVGISAGLVIPCTGDSSITVDLYKNGVTVLSSNMTLDSTIADYETVVGTAIDGEEDYTAGDVFEIVVTVSAGTGTLGQGLFVQTILNEDAVA